MTPEQINKLCEFDPAHFRGDWVSLDGKWHHGNGNTMTCVDRGEIFWWMLNQMPSYMLFPFEDSFACTDRWINYTGATSPTREDAVINAYIAWKEANP